MFGNQAKGRYLDNQLFSQTSPTTNGANGINITNVNNNVDASHDTTTLEKISPTTKLVDESTVKRLKSTVSPSNLGAVRLCPGILAFDSKKNNPQPVNQVNIDSIPDDFMSRRYADAERGRYLHALIVERLRKYIYDMPEHTRVSFLLDNSPQAKEIVDGCIHHIKNQYLYLYQSNVYIEYTLNCLSNYNIDGFYGRVDCAIITESYAEIIDFKTGYEPVNHENNLQLLSYAAGLKAIRPEIDNFKLTIVQPKTRIGNNTSSIYLTAAELDALIKQEIIPSVLQCEAGELPFNLGDHCKKCPHLYECTAGLQYYLSPLTDIVNLIQNCGSKLDTYALSQLMRLRDLQTICDNARKRIISDTNKGIFYPDIKFKKSMTEVFDDNNKDAVVKKLQELGIDPYNHIIKTPKELQSVLEPEVYAEHIAPHVYKKLKSTSVNYCA